MAKTRVEQRLQRYKPPPSSADSLTHTVFVRGLPLDVQKRALMAVMQKFGPIKSCRIVMHSQTGKSRGTAFIDFADAQGAQNAVEESERGRCQRMRSCLKLCPLVAQNCDSLPSTSIKCFVARMGNEQSFPCICFQNPLRVHCQVYISTSWLFHSACECFFDYM